jgi:hypothetical protein
MSTTVRGRCNWGCRSGASRRERGQSVRANEEAVIGITSVINNLLGLTDSVILIFAGLLASG